MRIVVQRVKHASVTVDQQIIGEIDHGLMLLVGFGVNDINPDFTAIARRIGELRVFTDKQSGKLAHSLLDVDGGVLAVPQFTLYGEVSKGRRPNFTTAMAATPAREYFGKFVDALKQTPLARLQTGEFGADMQVSLVNDGPLTLILEF